MLQKNWKIEEKKKQNKPYFIWPDTTTISILDVFLLSEAQGFASL